MLQIYIQNRRIEGGGDIHGIVTAPHRKEREEREGEREEEEVFWPTEKKPVGHDRAPAPTTKNKQPDLSRHMGDTHAHTQWKKHCRGIDRRPSRRCVCVVCVCVVTWSGEGVWEHQSREEGGGGKQDKGGKRRTSVCLWVSFGSKRESVQVMMTVCLRCVCVCVCECWGRCMQCGRAVPTQTIQELKEGKKSKLTQPKTRQGFLLDVLVAFFGFRACLSRP
jgi:hypothetical protein